jgi:D-alanyl-D-alanine carboxypeptidase
LVASIKWIGRFAVAASALLAGHSLAASAGPNLLFEPATGAVISQAHAGMAWYPASLTKLMTAYLTFEALREGRLKLDQQIPVSSIAAIQPASKIGIGAGSKVSVDFALQALLVHSANDMAVVLAEAAGGDLASFVVEMNKAAKRLGMSGTRFLNPSGLHDPNHYSTARDIGVLAAKIQQEFPEHRHYFSQDYVAVGKRRLSNHNALLRLMPEVDGMKTGFVCAAGYNVVVSAMIGNRRLLAVVLGAANGQSRTETAKNLLTLAGAAPSAGTTVQQIVDVPVSDGFPPDVSEEICAPRKGAPVRSARELKGYGVSLGQFNRRDEASMALRIWSEAGDMKATHAVKGLVQLPKTPGYAAMIWDVAEEEAQGFCQFVKERNENCAVMGPEVLKGFAEAAPPPKIKSGKPKRKRKKRKA